MYRRALKLAYKAHDGQLRKDSNVPYIIHPIRVSYCFNDLTRKTIAILHDVIEDTSFDFDDLRDAGMPDRIMNIVDILTRKKYETHMEYVKRVSKNEIATEIKIADIVDNLSDTISVQKQSMIDRYNKSLEILTNFKY